MDIQIRFGKQVHQLFMGEEPHDWFIGQLPGTQAVASVFQPLSCKHQLNT